MNLFLLTLILVFVFGLCVGSFLNVVIHRLPLNLSIISPRSHCPNCKSAIRWQSNIPIFSYLLQGGKCASCKQKIPWRYPLVEFLTALLFLLAAWREPNMLHWPFQFYFLAALICSTFIDLDHWIIPDKITLSGILFGFTYSFLLPESFWLQSIFGILFGGGVLLFIGWIYQLVAKRDGIGGGDIKFLAFVGAYLGVQGALVTIVLSSILGSILGIFLIAWKGKKGNAAIPFGPFLALGALSAFLFGPELLHWYFELHN